jgi:hypothetical protein
MAAADYCTLESLKARVGITDTSHDAVLEEEITAASRAIDRWCSRPDGGFVAQTATRTFDVPATAFGALRPAPLAANYAGDAFRGVYLPTYEAAIIDLPALLSVTSVKTDPAGDGSFSTTWLPTDYDLLPRNAAADGDPYRAIRARTNGAQSFVVGAGTLQIAGSWGESTTVPPTVQRACVLYAYRLFKRNESVYGVVSDLVSAEGGAIRIPSVDSDIKQLLFEAGYLEVWAVV